MNLTAPRLGRWRIAAVTGLALAGLAAPSLSATAAPAGRVVGHVDVITAHAGTVTVSGWAASLETPDKSAHVDVYVGGRAGTAGVVAHGQILANTARPDVDKATGLGARHGFSLSLSSFKGSFPVCTYLSDAVGNNQVFLGCTTVPIPYNETPIGHLEHAYTDSHGHLQFIGWTVDIDTLTRPTRVAIYLGGPVNHAYKAVTVTANAPRPDLLSTFTGTGEYHGFNVSIPALPGTYVSCVYAIDTATPPGPSTLLGCPVTSN